MSTFFSSCHTHTHTFFFRYTWIFPPNWANADDETKKNLQFRNLYSIFLCKFSKGKKRSMKFMVQSWWTKCLMDFGKLWNWLNFSSFSTHFQYPHRLFCTWYKKNSNKPIHTKETIDWPSVVFFCAIKCCIALQIRCKNKIKHHHLDLNIEMTMVAQPQTGNNTIEAVWSITDHF